MMTTTDTGPIPTVGRHAHIATHDSEGWWVPPPATQPGEALPGTTFQPPQTPVEALENPSGYDHTGRCLHCGRAAQRPFWQTWWVWVIALIVLLTILSPITGG